MSEIKPKQRIFVNVILLIYWLPAVIVDLTYPTTDEYKIITSYLQNWCQIWILFHLIITLWLESIHFNDETLKNIRTEGLWNERYLFLKIIKDQVAQATIDITVLSTLNFIILDLCIFKIELTSYHIHENFNAVIIIFISYSVSDIEFRIHDILPALTLLWFYIILNFIPYLNGKNIYPFVAGSDKNRQDIFILVTSFLLSVELIFIHLVMFSISLLKKEISRTKKLSETSVISA